MGQAPYILYKVEFQHTTFGSQSPFPDSHSVLIGCFLRAAFARLGFRRPVILFARRPGSRLGGRLLHRGLGGGCHRVWLVVTLRFVRRTAVYEHVTGPEEGMVSLDESRPPNV